MEARDTPARIRLLPPDTPNEPPGPPQRPQRPWLGPAVLLGVIAVFALVIGLGPSNESTGHDAEDAAAPVLTTDAATTTSRAPASPTTTAPAPAPLLDQVPDLATELSLVGLVDNLDGSSNVVTAVWNGRLPAPGSRNVFDRTTPLVTEFAGDSRMMAMIGTRLPDGIATLYVGSTSSLAPQFVGVTSFAWIEGDSLALAFTAQSPGDDRLRLYRADVATRGALVDLTPVADVSLSARVAGAGPWGYLVTESTIISTTTLLDIDGTPLRSVAGMVLDVAADGRFALASAQKSLDVARESGATSADLGFSVEPVTLGPGEFAILDVGFNELTLNGTIRDVLDDGWVEFSPDGSLVMGTAAAVADRWSVRTAGLDESLGRITSIIGATGYLGWSNDGTYLIYATDVGLAFHNWDRGTTHHVAFDRDYDLLTVGG